MLIDFRQLWPKYNIHPTGVLHVGANVGEEAPVYLELGVKKQIWIEANPKIFDILVRNLAGNHEAKAYNFAAGDENTETILHESNNGSQSSSILELGNHSLVHPDVHYINDIPIRMYRIETFFKKIGNELTDNLYDLSDIDFLNLDVQGFEANVLHGMGDLLNQFKWIYTEVNSKETYKKCMLLPDLDLFLSDKGFRRVETFNAGGFLDRLGWSDALYCR